MPEQPSHAHAAPLLPAPLAERTLALADEAATLAFGERFAHALDAVRGERAAAHAFDGLQIQLYGDLGAGKTTLVRAMLRGLGHAGRVKSPTYTLVEPYALARSDGELEVYHFDLYRFSDPAEWADAGFREYFNSGAICVVEWPQRAGALLGVPDLVFSLDVDGEGRLLTARAYSASGKACLERC
ncbi:bifunctional tRNA (adenosine(37)-N6)-threonylcarbamoyltransferase complex ATPase subunit type 1 TsaE/phosphotransferase [Burkholderia oklahomensis]|uniref:tRNA threonylcarbamoyladenosine biosynthesis protein TsaE n=1 Tax=Burkholderia oklahomensis TaxID=342113 RepID=A0AAI8FMM4_9BURK|nr:bifunctional tRNA (adenosine(37)-N6)-threonylcarbamoyltransferase complex ATPase subunit type 1 TsaE/phosphotransferase [Burkholderia oklahomensis]AIO65955.1 tRNA threonylcarbamoyl adenosine modification protein YjeE [Burkholderia oklahomensis]AJX32804.1 tRNA threonylcarbamoyl adenosine modification protein YjeE [Burkholderia oklahomensis C6786]AOI43340.1 tRNA threonylcarbamoyladenosine biosynthesis protein TsaE [Burkholderia oklahomensis EO147]AOI46910.1 tRNA threonylcarbamoyladenosine bios